MSLITNYQKRKHTEANEIKNGLLSGDKHPNNDSYKKAIRKLKLKFFKDNVVTLAFWMIYDLVLIYIVSIPYNQFNFYLQNVLNTKNLGGKQLWAIQMVMYRELAILIIIGIAISLIIIKHGLPKFKHHKKNFQTEIEKYKH